MSTFYHGFFYVLSVIGLFVCLWNSQCKCVCIQYNLKQSWQPIVSLTTSVFSGRRAWVAFLLPFLFIPSYPVLLSPPSFSRLFLCSPLGWSHLAGPGGSQAELEVSVGGLTSLCLSSSAVQNHGLLKGPASAAVALRWSNSWRPLQTFTGSATKTGRWSSLPALLPSRWPRGHGRCQASGIWPLVEPPQK